MVFTVSLVFTGNYSIFFVAFGIYVLLCIVAAFCRKFHGLIIFVFIVLAGILVLQGMEQVAIITLIILFDQSSGHSRIGSVVIIAIMLIMSAISILYFNPDFSYIYIRTIIVATVATILAKQLDATESFLHSSYCRRVSSKVVSSVFRRGYITTITIFMIIIIVAFVVQPQSTDPYLELADFSEEIESFEDFLAQSPFIREAPPEEEVYEYILEFYEGSDDLDLTGAGGFSLELDILMIASLLGLILIVICITVLSRYSQPAKQQFDDFDEDDEETAFVSEKKRRNRRIGSVFGMNYTVRRMFKRKVKEYTKDERVLLHKSDTPKKIAVNVGEWEDISPLQQLYHKARYSGENVTRVELKELTTKKKEIR